MAGNTFGVGQVACGTDATPLGTSNGGSELFLAPHPDNVGNVYIGPDDTVDSTNGCVVPTTGIHLELLNSSGLHVIGTDADDILCFTQVGP